MPGTIHTALDSGAARFVGRDEELAELVAALPTRTDGRAALHLISGVAGIGKSRLLTELAGHAAERGVRVVWGRCWDAEASPAYWAWTQVARELLQVARETELGALLLDDAATADQFELYDGLAGLLAEAAAETPLLILLEDLHLADAESLVLTRFIRQQLAGSPVLLVGTIRTVDGAREASAPDVEASDRAAALAALLAAGTSRELAPLPRSAVHSLIADGTHADEVFAASGGNPLFIEQVRRAPAPEGAAGRHPSLYSITADRLAALPAKTMELVRALAVVGPQPTVAELAALVRISGQECLALLEPAIAAGIVAGRPADAPRGLDFTHQLLLEAVLRATDPAEAERLHRDRAALLAGDDRRVAERARHLLYAGETALGEAVEACLSAARISADNLAFEEASRLCGRALEALDRGGSADEVARIRLLLEQGRARWYSRDQQGSDASFDEAWRRAVASGDVVGQALAAIGAEYRMEFVAAAGALRGERCREVLTRLPEGELALRAKVTATLASTRLEDPIEASALAAVARDLAERSGDAVALGYALAAELVTELGPDSVERRLAESRRVAAIAQQHGERSLVTISFFMMLAALLEKGDTRSLDAELLPRGVELSLSAERANGRHAGWFRCTRALLDGSAELAETLANSSLLAARGEGDPDAESVWAAQISIVRWLQGRAVETEPLFLQARQAYPEEPVWSASLAWVWLLQGRTDAARGLVAGFADLSLIPRDRNWLAALAILAEVAAVVGEESLVAELRDHLLPYARRLVPIGLGVACWGTGARPLGLLARRLGNRDEAISHFRTAVQVSSDVGAQAWLAEAQLELAEVLAETAGGRAEAVRLVREAGVAARGGGWAAIAARAESLTAEVADGASEPAPVNLDAADPGATAPSPEPPGASAGSIPLARISVLGVFEVVSADGTVARWSSRKARELLKILVARHGAAIPRETVMDLLWPGEAPELLSNRMSVATATVRRALDPRREFPTDAYLRVQGEVLSLRIDRLDIDVGRFLAQARTALAAPPGEEAFEALSATVSAYRGDALADEPYAEWAEPLRREAQTLYCAVARALAELATERGDHLIAAENYRSIVYLDAYDGDAHEGLVRSLVELGAHGQAAAARERHRRQLAELGLPEAG